MYIDYPVLLDNLPQIKTIKESYPYLNEGFNIVEIDHNCNKVPTVLAVFMNTGNNVNENKYKWSNLRLLSVSNTKFTVLIFKEQSNGTIGINIAYIY